MADSPTIIGSIEAPLCWEDFELEIKNLRDELEAERRRRFRYSYIGNWLFRGQCDARWGLKTSLERHLENVGEKDVTDIRLLDYLQKMRRTVPAINSLAGKQFKIQFRKPKDTISPWDLHWLQLLYYLRHHGFPTPTLDWSRSYLVSAYFAFQPADKDRPVAIYAYNENMKQTRSTWAQDPYIRTLGPYVETHRRHFLQQSEYTYCTTEKDENLYFARHDDAMSSNPQSHPCKKFILAGKEREKVLQKLDEANINAYTLYGNEEGLMEMLAFRELRF